MDVRLLLPGIPDHKFAYLAAQSHYGELLVHRVKIYIYEPGLLHGKTVLSDGEAAFVGSVNMDYRSFQLHFECGTCYCYGVPAIEGLAEDIQRITDRSRRVTYQEWKSRPWYRKLLSTLLRLFEMWMSSNIQPRTLQRPGLCFFWLPCGTGDAYELGKSPASWSFCRLMRTPSLA